jgi:hypothetical protein
MPANRQRGQTPVLLKGEQAFVFSARLGFLTKGREKGSWIGCGPGADFRTEVSGVDKDIRSAETMFMGLVDTGTPKPLLLASRVVEMLGKKRSMASGAAEYSRKNMSDLPLLSSHLCRVDEEGNTLRHALMRFFSRPREPGQPFLQGSREFGLIACLLNTAIHENGFFVFRIGDCCYVAANNGNGGGKFPRKCCSFC